MMQRGETAEGEEEVKMKFLGLQEKLETEGVEGRLQGRRETHRVSLLKFSSFAAF